MSEGFVYILTNAAMPDFIKIGLTTKPDVADRVRQLDNTSTPLPFEVFYAARVPDCRKLEQTLHFVFGDKRARQSREFFRSDPDLARAIIELVAIKEETLSDTEQEITPRQRVEIEAAKRSRTERLTLERLGLGPGTVLTFAKDPLITCEVAGPRTVKFRGREQSLSQAALTVIHEMGYTWPAVSGPEYWTLDGTKLAALRPRADDDSGS
jgi:hypothetical protein